MANELRIKNGIIIDNFANAAIYTYGLSYNPTTGEVGYMSTASFGSGSTITGATILGGATAGFISKFASANSLENSVIYENGGNIGIGTGEITLTDKLQVNGNAFITNGLAASSSIKFPNLSEASKTRVVVWDSADGRLYVTASSAFGGGGGGTGAGFPYSGSAVITGSLLISGSNNPVLTSLGNVLFDRSRLGINTGSAGGEETGFPVYALDVYDRTSIPPVRFRTLQNAGSDDRLLTTSATGVINYRNVSDIINDVPNQFVNFNAEIATAGSYTIASQDSRAPEITSWFIDYQIALIDTNSSTFISSKAGSIKLHLFRADDYALSATPVWTENSVDIPANIAQDLRNVYFTGYMDVDRMYFDLVNNSPYSVVLRGYYRTIIADNPF
jgi:hypothetical protein